MLGYLLGAVVLWKLNPVRVVTEPIEKGIKVLDVLNTKMELGIYKNKSEEGIIPKQQEVEMRLGVGQLYLAKRVNQSQLPPLCTEFAGAYNLSPTEWSIFYAVIEGINSKRAKGRPTPKEWLAVLEYYQEVSKARQR